MSPDIAQCPWGSTVVPAENYGGKHKNLLQAEVLIHGSSGWSPGVDGASIQQG